MERNRGISRFSLQLIAMILMLVDHLAASYKMTPITIALRILGRGAFILYAFLLADGFIHIKDDNKKLSEHVILLGVLAVISEMPFNFLSFGRQYSDFPSYQNVIITLLLAYLLMILYEKFYYKFVILIPFAFAVVLCNYLKPDYGIEGVLLAFGFYLYLDGKKKCNYGFAVKFIFAAIMIGLFYATTNMFGPISIPGYFIAFILILCYNGKKGPITPAFNIIFKLFYPLHLMALTVTCWG